MAKHTKDSQSNSEDKNLDKTNNKRQVQRSIAKKRLLVSSIVLASCLAGMIVIGELYSR